MIELKQAAIHTNNFQAYIKGWVIDGLVHRKLMAIKTYLVRCSAAVDSLIYFWMDLTYV